MKRKVLEKMLREDRQAFMQGIRYSLWQSDNHALEQLQQENPEEWSTESAKNFSNATEERGRRQADYRDKQQYMKTLQRMENLENIIDKMHSKTDKQLDNLKRCHDKDKDEISKLCAGIKDLSSDLKKEKTKRKELGKKIRLLEKALAGIAFYLGISGPWDSPYEIHRKVQNTCNLYHKKRNGQKGILNCIDAEYKEVDSDD